MPKHDKTMDLYASLMQEVKVRIEAINVALKGQMNIPSPIAREFCYLQLRMICELISLGCLAAHGDIVATSKFRKEWSAEKIINALGELHGDFYPRPVIQQKGKQPAAWDLEFVESGFLAKSELLELYGKCGDILHRGTLKNLMKAKSPIQRNFPDVLEWGNKIVKLLSVHTIFSKNGSNNYVCVLSAHDKNGDVVVGFAEEVPWPPAS